MRPPNPESILLRKGTPEGLTEKEEALHKLLVLERKKKTIDIDTFSDHYSKESIESDKKFVDERKQRYAKERTDGDVRGELFEAIVADQISNSDWMGKDADSTFSTDYDDYRNGIDIIVEFEREEGDMHLALAIDVTESPRKMLEKLKNIKAAIRTGSLGHLKYFKSKHLREKMRGIPHVVVGAGYEVLGNISELLLRFKRLQATIEESRKSGQSASEERALAEFTKVRSAVAEHPLQGMLLNEIKLQLESFREYAHTIGKEDVVDQYSKILALIDNVIEKKGDLAKNDESFKEDPVFRMILENRDLKEI